jgi:hypothetical protein
MNQLGGSFDFYDGIKNLGANYRGLCEGNIGAEQAAKFVFSKSFAQRFQPV